MTLNDLIDEFRTISQDVREPYLVSNESLVKYANEAVQQACERAPLLWDSTSAFCTVPIVAATATYTLDAAVRQIDDFRLRSNGEALAQTSETVLQRIVGNRWPTDTDTPRAFIRHDGKIRLYPIPAVNDTLDLSVYRLPTATEAMTLAHAKTASPIIPAKYHIDLVYWMLHRFYLVDDVDIAAAQAKAGTYFDLFESKFGIRPTARLERFRQDTATELYQQPIVGVR